MSGDVWPSDEIRDDERALIAQRQPILISKAVTLGDLLEACDEADIEWDEVQLAAADSTLGLAIEVSFT